MATVRLFEQQDRLFWSQLLEVETMALQYETLSTTQFDQFS